MKDNQSSLNELIEKRNNLLKSTEILQSLIKSDCSIMKYCKKNSMNYLWVNDRLSLICDTHFVVTFEDFISSMKDPNHNVIKEVLILFRLLVQMKFIRLLDSNIPEKYLISEKWRFYSDCSQGWGTDALNYFHEYADIDNILPDDVIEHYKLKYSEDSWGAPKYICDYFGYEYCDEIIIC